MSHKFEANREVSHGYHKIPILYTGIKHPNNADKELVLMDDFGKHSTACYRNNRTCKVGIYFLVKHNVDKTGFFFKGKEILFKNCGRVF